MSFVVLFLTSSSQDDVEVHAVDTDARIVSNTQIDVLGDTKAEVARLRKVRALQLVLLYFETFLKNLLGLLASNCAMNGDLFVSSDTERTHRVSS